MSPHRVSLCGDAVKALSRDETNGRTEQTRTGPGLNPAERFAVCELVANRAQTVVQPLVLAAASKLFDGLGASATAKSCNLDRHWRNARTVATHNPAIYKARIVGDYEVNGTAPRKFDAVGDVPSPYAARNH